MDYRESTTNWTRLIRKIHLIVLLFLRKKIFVLDSSLRVRWVWPMDVEKKLYAANGVISFSNTMTPGRLIKCYQASTSNIIANDIKTGHGSFHPFLIFPKLWIRILVRGEFMS